MPNEKSQNVHASQAILDRVDQEIARRQSQKRTSQQLPAIGYRPGQVLHFGSQPELCIRSLSGFSHPEKTHRWTEGIQASIEMLLDHLITRTQLLRLNIAPLIGPTLPVQTIRLSANGQSIAIWEVAEEGDYYAILPSQAKHPQRSLTIDIYAPNARSPKDLGQSEDGRVLGVALRELEIREFATIR